MSDKWRDAEELAELYYSKDGTLNEAGSQYADEYVLYEDAQVRFVGRQAYAFAALKAVVAVAITAAMVSTSSFSTFGTLAIFCVMSLAFFVRAKEQVRKARERRDRSVADLERRLDAAARWAAMSEAERRRVRIGVKVGKAAGVTLEVLGGAIGLWGDVGGLFSN